MILQWFGTQSALTLVVGYLSVCILWPKPEAGFGGLQHYLLRGSGHLRRHCGHHSADQD